MSILIKNKAVPKTCEECLFYGIDVESGCFLEKCFVIRRVGQDKPSWCPLVSVPPHGRLIDADEFQMKCFRRNFSNQIDNHEMADINMLLHLSPTIIPAEEVQE